MSNCNRIEREGQCDGAIGGTIHEGIIRTKIFFDQNGERTCALDFEKGAVCEFYRTQHFGTHETCLFAPSAGKRTEKLERRGSDGLGLLIPGKWCPLKTE